MPKIKRILSKLPVFVRSYIETALWSETDGDDPLDKNYGPEDLALPTLRKMIADCEAFQSQAADVLAKANEEDKKVAHDFWLTRNEHGAGFWDGDYEDEIGEALTKIAKTFGREDIYPGDDGKLYLMGAEQYGEDAEKLADVSKLNWIAKLEALGFRGPDGSLEESLFEYGIAWLEKEGRVLFIYGIDYKDDKPAGWVRFDRVWMDPWDIESDFDWIDAADILKYTGDEHWVKRDYTSKVHDLMQYYGFENVFGSRSWKGFEIMPKEITIEVYYETWDEEAVEAGDTDDKGEEETITIGIDDTDEDTTLAQAIAKQLKDRGIIAPSSTSFSTDVWYSSIDESRNMFTGESTTYSAHIKGADEDTLEEVFNIVTERRK